MFDKDKAYANGVWDMTFYVIDTDTDEPMRNKDGTVKQFRADKYLASHIVDTNLLADALDVDDLKEAQPIVHLYKGELIK